MTIWLPNLVWQAANGWPQLELARDIQGHEGGENRALLVPLQILIVGPLLVPLLGAGLWALLRDPALRPWRAIGYAYPILLALVLVTGGKPYYAGPLLVCLLAPAGVVVGRWVRGPLRAIAVGAAIAVTALVSAVLALPVVPVQQLAGSGVADVNEDAGETVGWPAFVRTVARVHRSLAPGDRASAIVFTGNYGEAGAIDRYGPARGLPRAYSGHNAYARFGVPPGSAGPVIVLGFGDPGRWFHGCRQVARIDNGVGVENEEQGGHVFVCEGPRRPWAELWPELTHLSA